jgi:CDP-paratose 2-epimerase
MKILITGICGFVGSTLARNLLATVPHLTIAGFDNFMRPGCEMNRGILRDLGVEVQHADLRNPEDIQALPSVDYVIDAAANPSVLAGTGLNANGSRSLMQHNLVGTINLLEFCKERRAGLILLSTSRVYSIAPLSAVRLEVMREAFVPCADQAWPAGMSVAGIGESFPTAAPISLYGATKVCSEALALEYGQCFGFPVWVNRLGVLAGAGQFGRADQGIFSFWIHSCAGKRSLKFTGFGGHGYQVRDCLHPRDLVEVLLRQMTTSPSPGQAIINFSGGASNSMSLLQLHHWCEGRFGKSAVASDTADRPFDVPWLVLDSSLAHQRFGWKPSTGIQRILDEIATHAEQNPNWLQQTAA